MKTEAEIQELIEQRAEEFSTYRSDEPHEGLNIHAFDQYVGFKHGVTLGREIECGQVRELVSMLQQKSEHDPDCSDQHETFNHLQDCECGAIQIQFAIKKYQAARGDGHG